jgi:hypothetical protein
MEQSGEPDHSQPFGILLKGFFIFRKLFIGEKEGFLKSFVVLILRCRKIVKD